jgi:hypothetical protein
LESTNNISNLFIFSQNLNVLPFCPHSRVCHTSKNPESTETSPADYGKLKGLRSRGLVLPIRWCLVLR